MVLGCTVLHAWSSVLETMCASMMVVAIGSLAFTSIELHAQSGPLVVVIAPSAPVLVLVEQGGFRFAFTGAFVKAFALPFALGITRRKKRFGHFGFGLEKRWGMRCLNEPQSSRE